MTKLEEWLERMQTFQSDHAGAAVSIQVTRNNRDLGWHFEINAETNLAELVDHIDSSCRDSGFAGPYELRAFDAQGRLCGPFSYKTQVAEIVPSSASMMMPEALASTFDVGLQSQTAFTKIALKGIAQSHRYTTSMMDRLEKENARLAKERDELRIKLDSHLDTLEKLNTHEIEAKEEAERVKRMGNMAETVMTALVGRFTGKGTTESQVIDMRLGQLLFRSLASDLPRMQKLLEHLTDDERMAVMELAKRATEQPETPTLPDKPNGLAAASAAAATNGKGN